MFRKCVSGLCFLSLVLVGAASPLATTYTFTDLGVIGGGSSYGYGRQRHWASGPHDRLRHRFAALYFQTDER